MMESSPPIIAITGTGLVCAAGHGPLEAWQTIVRGRTSIGPLGALEQSATPACSGGEIPAEFLGKGAVDGLPREVCMLRHAIADALSEARLRDAWTLTTRSRAGLLLGTTLGGMRGAGEFLRTGDFTTLRAFLAGRTLELAAVDLPDLHFATTTCAACASGLYAISAGMALLASGELDIVIAGGYDPISEYAYAGFNSLRLVAGEPPRPFSRFRAGMNLGEGAGVVVLERIEDAARRSVPVVAVIESVGESSDVHHLTQPHPEGRGAIEAMRGALNAANGTEQSIDLVCAHATATPANDASEFLAYQHVLGKSAAKVPVVALKSHLGHTLGAAGAVELVLATQAMIHQSVPPTVGTTAADLEFSPLDLQFEQPRTANIRRVIITSMGFGGANAAAVIKRPAEHPAAATAHVPGLHADFEPVITGVGVVINEHIGNDAFAAALKAAKASRRMADAKPISDEAIEHLLNARRVRRISPFAKWMLAATTGAMRDAEIHDVPAWAAHAHAMLGTTHGAATYSEEYYRQVVKEGISAANPVLFAEGVPNVASAHLSLVLGVRGGAQTIIGTRTAGLEALALAASRIRMGLWDRAIVGAAEEITPLMIDAYRAMGLHAAAEPSIPLFGRDGFVCGCGAVALVLESRRQAVSRRAPMPAVVESVGLRHTGTRGVRSQIRALSELLRSTGGLSTVIGSANGTWIDRVETAALKRAYVPSRWNSPPNVSTINDLIGETFSVGPLAAIAATLLNRPADATRIGVIGVDSGQSALAVVRAEAANSNRANA